jgi:hypothetical protein
MCHESTPLLQLTDAAIHDRRGVNIHFDAFVKLVGR